LCTEKCISLLRTTCVSAWHGIILSSCVNACAPDRQRWREVIREVLHYEEKVHSGHGMILFGDRHSGINEGERLDYYEFLTKVPDDLLVLLLRRGYLSPRPRMPLANIYEPDTDDYIYVLSRRFTSCPLAKLRGPRSHVGWSDPVNLEAAVDIGAKDIVDLLLPLQSVIRQAEAHEHRRLDLPTVLQVARLPTMEEVHQLQNLVRVAVAKGAVLTTPADAVAFRCLRRCKNNQVKALELYRDLSKATKTPDADLSLNFPAGYWKVGNRYAVKLSIVGSLYRWNWRLRRRLERPLSAADKVYLCAVPGCLDGLDGLNAKLARDFLMVRSMRTLPSKINQGAWALSTAWSDVRRKTCLQDHPISMTPRNFEDTDFCEQTHRPSIT